MKNPSRGGSYARVAGELVLVTPPTADRECKCRETSPVTEVTQEVITVPDLFPESSESIEE